MTLKGLSNYEIIPKDAELRVLSKHGYRRIKLNAKGYYMKRDDGKFRCFTLGHLRYLMAHPDIDACSIDLRALRLKFTDDGTPTDLYPQHRSRSYLCFRDIDDVQRTVDIMREVFDGNVTTALEFIEEFRSSACGVVANLLKISFNSVRPHIDEAEEDFLRELKNANVREIKPLFAWFCKCVKYACVRNRNKQTRIDAAWSLDRDRKNASCQPACEI